jgi:two-component system LytT family response regulator
MVTVNALIVEDDPFFSELLTDMLSLHFPYIQAGFVACSLQEARGYLSKNRIDLLFLDIELPDGKGFELLSSMDEVNFEVIVTTSHSSYAIDAVRHSALDYLLKPVPLPEMEAAIAKFLRKFQPARQNIQDTLHAKPVFRKLPLHTSDGFVFVNIDEIIHAEADRSYSLFSLKDDSRILVSKPLGEFEDRLEKHAFFRVHKSHIINLHEISKYVRGEGGHVVMTNQSVVPVSRTRKDDFLRIIGQ